MNNDKDSIVGLTTNSEKHMLNVYEIGRKLDKNFPTDRIIDTWTEEIADKMIKEYPEKLSKKWNKETNDWIDEVSKEFFLDNVFSYIGDNIKHNYIEKLNIE